MRIGRIAPYVLAFLAVPTLMGCLVALPVWLAPSVVEPAPLEAPLPPPPEASTPARPWVAALVYPDGTEITELFAPYGMLAASEVLDVLTVAPERALLPVWPSLGIVPDRGLDTLADSGLEPPSLVVVPGAVNPDNPAILTWLGSLDLEQTTLLAVGDGARVAAEAGLLEGRRCTSHFRSLDALERRYPGTEWVRGVRWVADGPVICTAGVASALNGTVRALRQVAGDEVAEATARALEQPRRKRELREPVFRLKDRAVGVLDAGFRLGQDTMGVLVYPGVDEIHLAATLDVYARPMAWRTVTVGQPRRPFRTLRGLTLVSDGTLEEAPGVARLLMPPGDTRGVPRLALQAWSERTGQTHDALAATAPDETFEQLLLDLSRHQSEPLARRVSKQMQYPQRRLDIDMGPDWPWRQTALPLIYGLVGVLLVWSIRVLRAGRD